MPGREDYILSYIAQLRRAIAQMLNLRTTGRSEEALHVARSTQERLFGRTTAVLATLDLAELLRLLRLDETPEAGDEKILGYATLLRETGLVYEAMDRRDSAQSCFQLALQVTLMVVVGSKVQSPETWTALRELLARVPADQLHAPVQELLRLAGEPS